MVGADLEYVERLLRAHAIKGPVLELGTGYGGTTCRAIIEAHEGRLWVAPNTPHGSVFHFILPTDTAMSAGRHEEGNPATSHPRA